MEARKLFFFESSYQAVDPARTRSCDSVTDFDTKFSKLFDPARI